MFKKATYLIVIVLILSACQSQERKNHGDLDDILLKSLIDISRTKELTEFISRISHRISLGTKTAYEENGFQEADKSILENIKKIQAHTQIIVLEIDNYIEVLYNGKDKKYLLQNYGIVFQEKYSIKQGNAIK